MRVVDLVVDGLGDAVAVVGLLRYLPAEEDQFLALAKSARTELLAHAVAHDHLPRKTGGLLDVIARAGRYPLGPEDLLFGGPCRP